jgi:hypothetical protein
MLREAAARGLTSEEQASLADLAEAVRALLDAQDDLSS